MNIIHKNNEVHIHFNSIKKIEKKQNIEKNKKMSCKYKKIYVIYKSIEKYNADLAQQAEQLICNQ